MNVTPARQGLTPLIWDTEFLSAEHVRKNQFARYMGTQMGSMIQVLRGSDPASRAIPVVSGPCDASWERGVTGNTILEGNEEIFNAPLAELDRRRVPPSTQSSRTGDEQKSVIDLREAAREALMVWELEKMRNDITHQPRGDDGGRATFRCPTAPPKPPSATRGW